MDWKTLIDTNFSKKAGVCVLTILALCYLGTQPEKVPEEVYWYVMATGVTGMFVQGVLDFIRPNNRKGKPCEEPLSPPPS